MFTIYTDMSIHIYDLEKLDFNIKIAYVKALF